jgi:hypothetical protein
MKAKIIIFCVLIMYPQYLSADEVYFHWNLGNISNELNIYQGKRSYVFSTQLLNYYIDFNTRVFFEISPFKYWFFSEDETKKITFLNFSAFFNLSNNYRTIFLFGPIVSINWLENENLNKFEIENYIFSIGLKFHFNYGFGLERGIFRYPSPLTNAVELELGYRNINGRHNIYVGIRIEPSILLSVFSALYYPP